MTQLYLSCNSSVCVQYYIGPCSVLVPTGTVHSNNEFEFEFISGIECETIINAKEHCVTLIFNSFHNRIWHTVHSLDIHGQCIVHGFSCHFNSPLPGSVDDAYDVGSFAKSRLFVMHLHVSQCTW